MSLISTINQSQGVQQFTNKLTPEQNAINEEAFDLVKEIVAMPDVENLKHQLNFGEEKIWYFYLTDFPNRLQSMINKAFLLNNNDGNLSKATILNNFISMCSHEGMNFNNPFNLFTLRTANYRRLIDGKF